MEPKGYNGGSPRVLVSVETGPGVAQEPVAVGVELLLANLSLPPAVLCAAPIAETREYVRKTGADGLELTYTPASRFCRRALACVLPVDRHQPPAHGDKGNLLGVLIEGGSSGKYAAWAQDRHIIKEIVRAQHSSFRNEVGDDGLAARLFPTWRDSLTIMQAIQTTTGELPAVLYPGFENGQVRYGEVNAPFSDRTFQPKADEWAAMGLTEDSSIEEIHEAMSRKGFTGIAFGILHAQCESKGYKFKDVPAFAGRLAAAGLIDEVHVEVNRLDITGIWTPAGKSTSNAKKAFVASAAAAAKTIEGETLQAIAEGWQQTDPDIPVNPKRIVLEDGPIQTPVTRWILRDQTAMIDTIKQLMEV